MGTAVTDLGPAMEGLKKSVDDFFKPKTRSKQLHGNGGTPYRPSSNNNNNNSFFAPKRQTNRSFFGSNNSNGGNSFRGRVRRARSRPRYFRQNPHKAFDHVLKPTSVAQLYGITLVVAEILDWCNLLDGDAPNKSLKRALRRAKSSLRYGLRHWWRTQRRLGGWLHKSTWESPAAVKRKIASLARKHQFSVGLGLGMIISPFCWSIGYQLLQAAAITYGLAEINGLMRILTDQSWLEIMATLKMIHWGTASDVDYNLERVRRFVHNTVLDPSYAVRSLMGFLDRVANDDGLTPNTKRGLAVGLVSGVLLV